MRAMASSKGIPPCSAMSSMSSSSAGIGSQSISPKRPTSTVSLAPGRLVIGAASAGTTPRVNSAATGRAAGPGGHRSGEERGLPPSAYSPSHRVHLPMTPSFLPHDNDSSMPEHTTRLLLLG
jgi:hypothetical protein